MESAAGIVAGTNNDSDNLSILLNAKALNPDVFFVVRQNKYRNQMVFRAGEADLIMMPSLVSARRILFLLIAPLLKPFFETLRERDLKEGKFIDAVTDHLHEVVGGTGPRLKTVEIDEVSAPAVMRVINIGKSVTLGDLLSNPVEPSRELPCVPLVLRRGTDTLVLPKATTEIALGDQILFCGRPQAYHLMDSTMHNEYSLLYIMTGKEVVRSYLLRWLMDRFRSDARACA